MQKAVLPFAGRTFITPMAAVAGAVAEEILAAMLGAAELDRAYVNDGGDIALHLAADESFTIGLIDRPDRPGLFGRATLSAGDGVRGIATSGWRGRSFSRGIADAVTILAEGAAAAVCRDHRRERRRPAGSPCRESLSRLRAPAGQRSRAVRSRRMSARSPLRISTQRFEKAPQPLNISFARG